MKKMGKIVYNQGIRFSSEISYEEKPYYSNPGIVWCFLVKDKYGIRNMRVRTKESIPRLTV